MSPIKLVGLLTWRLLTWSLVHVSILLHGEGGKVPKRLGRRVSRGVGGTGGWRGIAAHHVPAFC